MSRMKRLAAALALLMIAVFASESALAHGRRGRIGLGFYFGAPIVAAPYYYPRYYSPYYYPGYYYPPYYVPPPVTYIERAPAPAPQTSPSAPALPEYWFYCRESNAYYPYVGQCAGGWERVTPEPPS